MVTVGHWWWWVLVVSDLSRRMVLDPLSILDHDALVEAATDGELRMLTCTAGVG